MATDFNYENRTINAGGPIKPSGKDMPGDPRTRVNTFADIASIPVPYVGMPITVIQDETNDGKMTDYIVKSLKANSLGSPNSLVDQVQRYVDYLGANGQGVDTNNFATKEELGLKADKTELHSHINKTVLDGITSTNVDNWNNKVDKVEGKILTTNDYTNEEKQTVASLKATVGDTSSGLVKDVEDLKTNGVSQDNINAAIENYLTEHPVQSGATTEQAAQIEANKTAIGDANSGLTKEINDVKNVELQNLNTAIQTLETLVGVDETLGDKSGLPSGDANVIASINRIDSKTSTGTGLTSEQISQLQTAYEHSQSTHVNSNDIPTKISQLENDSRFVTQTQLDNVVISAGGFTVKNLSTSEISEILSAISVVVPVESIVASTNYLSINVGETRQITYNILPANATDKTVVYSSSDDSKLTVDQEGNIEAIASGDFMITLTCSNGVSTNCQVVVSEVSETVDVTGISLSESSLSMHTGDSVSLIASITPTTATNKSVVWESNESTIASVANGRVTALADGEAIITCRSVSNPDITATCTVSVTTLETLTSITDGLVHSYNLAGLSGDSTTVDDLTGTVPLTLDGFTDVVSSKTANGILVDSGTCLLKQGSVSPTVTNKYSIAFTVIGPIAARQGLLSCNTHGNNKGFAISTSNTNPYALAVTDSGYLLGDIFTIRDEYTYETIVVTIDYDIHEFKIYSHGELIKTADITNKSYEWSNIAWFNKGYWGGATGITYRNILMYNKVLSDEEVSTITSEICPKNYLTTNSHITNSNSNIMTHISCSSNVTNGKLLNLVNENYGLNVLSSDENGFLVSETQDYGQVMNNKASYIIKTGPIENNSDINRFVSALTLGSSGFESETSTYSYIQNSKITFRGTSVYLLQNSELSETADNMIAIIMDMYNGDIKFYINNQLKNTVSTSKIQFRRFENTIIPIKEYIVYNKLLDETELTNIYNELMGGN